MSQNTMPEKMINTRGAVLDVQGKYSTDHAVTTCMYTAYKKYVHVNVYVQWNTNVRHCFLSFLSLFPR